MRPKASTHRVSMSNESSTPTSGTEAKSPLHAGYGSGSATLTNQIQMSGHVGPVSPTPHVSRAVLSPVRANEATPSDAVLSPTTGPKVSTSVKPPLAGALITYPSAGPTTSEGGRSSRASKRVHGARPSTVASAMSMWDTTTAATPTPRHARTAHIVITISDTGPGLEGVDTERLFQPFEQGPAQAGSGWSSEGEQRGTGLGLSLARRLARAMGGDLELRNRTTCRGGLYIVTLPLTVCLFV